MKAYKAFELTCDRNRELFRAYKTLAGGAGRNHKYCSDILRAIVAQIVSAIDSYFHDKILESMERFIRISTRYTKNPDLPEKLKKLIKDNISIPILLKLAQNRKPIRSVKNKLEGKLYEKTLQHPGSVQDILEYIELTEFWDKVGSKIDLSAEETKSYLEELVKRRNKIVHEGDMIRSGAKRHRARKILREDVEYWLDFAEGLIDAAEEVVSEHLDQLEAQQIKSKAKASRNKK